MGKLTKRGVEVSAPGIFVEEVAGPRPIEGVETSTAAFVGVTARGSFKPRRVCSPADFERAFGPVQPLAHSFLGRAVQAFFANGGRCAWIARVAATRRRFTAAAFIGIATRTPRGLAALGDIEGMLQLAAPDLSHPRMAAEDRAVLRAAMVAQAMARRDRFVILDSPQGDRRLGLDDAALAAIDSFHAAIFGPWITVSTADGGTGLLPPSGHVAGIIARVDATRGVHKGPAAESIADALGLEFEITAAEQDVLNPRGFNALRRFAGRGLQVWGARTRSADPQWRYVPVRRLATSIELSLTRGLGWAAFEANGEPLWLRVRSEVENYLTTLWRRGALLGQRPREAFFVRCDRSTMTQADIDSGRLVCEVGIAPAKPAEFVVIRIGAWTRRDP